MTRIEAATGGRMGTVIRLACKREPAGFTPRDLLDLHNWVAGARRLEIDASPGWSDIGQFAMIYEGEQPWASYALSREAGQILVWNCVTLADIGRFGCMRTALMALPGGEASAASSPVCAEVIPFDPSMRRSAA